MKLPIRVWVRRVAAAIFIGCFGMASCAPAPPPNVLVLLIDALRADHLGSYGYERETSPIIDALAAESLLFENAHAQSPWTKPSIPTLFTSLYPIEHGVYEGEAHSASGALESDVLAADYTTLAEVFRERGYATVGYVHNAHLEARLGFAQGFEVYEHGNFAAPEINRRFLAFLDAEPERPFFAYLHYLDVHWPFLPEEPHRGRFPGLRPGSIFDRASWRGLRDRINDGTIPLTAADLAELVSRHDGAIAQLDHRLGELLDALRERRLLDRTVLLLTSDHGEELLDHGQVGHGGTLFHEVIEIPMLLRLPNRARVGRVSEPARLVDVFPTLLSAAGIGIPPGLEGRDLLSSLPDAPEIVAETRHKRSYRVSVRRGDWKLVRSYRAPRRPQNGGSQAGHFGLIVGSRVKAKGIFTPDGALHAEKLTVKSPSDDDFELSGPIDFVLPDENLLGIRGFRIDGEDLMAADGHALVPSLHAGEWVKVEGRLRDGRVLEADKLERLAADDHDDELEGLIARTEPRPDGGVNVRIGSADVIVTEKTRIKGLDPTPEQPPAAPAADAFTPERLLSEQPPPFEEQLFDLARDPREQRDRLLSEPAHAAALREELTAWFARMSRHRGAPVARETLDATTVDELRALGYLE